MAGKLYPPYIDGKIPAFCGTVLRVPFRHNRAVGINDIDGMICKIKTVSTNEWVWSIKAEDLSWGIDYDTGENYVLFDLSPIYRDKAFSVNAQTEEERYVPYYQWLTVGLYYKIQIAYIDKFNVTGYFSDVGVTKYTAKPLMYIDGLESQGTNNSKYNYVGVYNQQNGDITEKEYYYSFTIYDDAGEVFLTTGILTHNSSTDTESFKSSDEFYCNKELIPNRTYKLQYKITTNNGMICESPMYLISKKDFVKSSLNAKLQATYSFDDGYIALSLIPQDDRYYSGNFAVARSSSLDNFSTWDEICKFTLNKESPLRNLFTDFTVEQGVRYQYSLQQYNTKGLYSTRILSDIIDADFEDMFLYDGKRQLKIRFNPQVSSFKNDLLESKMDTIGGQYPFIFRNGNVKYKEFPINGLISYLMDDQGFFIKEEKLGPIEFKGNTDLTSDNIRAERIFKLEVLEWLNNGEPKLFRSPTEGNYLVRLMSVSLSPNTTVGRMLHTFAATAYEIGEVNFSNLNNLGMFEAPNLTNKIMRFKQIKLGGVYNNELGVYDIDPVTLIFTTSTPPSIATITARQDKPKMVGLSKCYVGVFEGVSPDSIFGIQFQSGIQDNLIEYIKIGGTGTYQVNSYDNPIVAVYAIWTPNITQPVAASRKFNGTFTYGYYTDVVVVNFSAIANFEVYSTLTQWYGEDGNIIDEIENISKAVGRIYWIKFSTRNVVKMFTSSAGRLYYDENKFVEIPKRDILPTSVYADYAYNPARYYNGADLLRRSTTAPSPNDNGDYYITINIRNNSQYYWTENTKDAWDVDSTPTDRLYKFAINHQDYNVDLKTINRYIITDLSNVKYLSIGRMLMVDCYYQVCKKIYSIEETDNELIPAKYAIDSAWETYWDQIKSEETIYLNKSQSYWDNEAAQIQTAENNYYDLISQKLNLDEEG